MNHRSKGRKAELEARHAWTERLNRFAAARTAKQRKAAIEAEIKINPGGALRDMLQAWGYSASSRGRKAKGAESELNKVPARQKLEAGLGRLYGEKPAPVSSLYKKLAGVAPTSVKDACRITAALISSWPEPIRVPGDSKAFAESFVRELLSDLSGGRSYEWSGEDIEIRVFNFVDEERVGVSEFISGAGRGEGALIVAGAKNILVGTHALTIIKEFQTLTANFLGKNGKGLLIFVFDAAIFEAGNEGYNLLYNIGLLTTAVTVFALYPNISCQSNSIQQHSVDWFAWRELSRRCCVVIRKPPFINPSTGELLKRDNFDQFFASWTPEQTFTKLDELKGFVRFDSSHVLPEAYPTGFSTQESSEIRGFYWDVRVFPASNEPDGLDVQYFIPPSEKIVSTLAAQQPQHRARGRPPIKAFAIEEDFIYIIRKPSPGPKYDDAQRAIYMAARGRLNLDRDEEHDNNLNAAAALRQLGYEVLPISFLLSLFPRTLHFASANLPNLSSVENATK
jgi:hypothetical protein